MGCPPKLNESGKYAIPTKLPLSKMQPKHWVRTLTVRNWGPTENLEYSPSTAIKSSRLPGEGLWYRQTSNPLLKHVSTARSHAMRLPITNILKLATITA